MMLTETYEIEEMTTDTREAQAITDEQVKIMEDLDLAGQLDFVNKPEDAPVTVRPYRVMTEEEIQVYQELFPTRTNLSEYNECPIPLRILQALSYCKGNDMFREYEVWHRTSSYDKDPLLVGLDWENSWNKKNFLIGRWGEALLPFEDLKDQAIKLAYDRVTKGFTKAKRQMNMFEAALTEEVNFLGRDTPAAYYMELS